MKKLKYEYLSKATCLTTFEAEILTQVDWCQKLDPKTTSAPLLTMRGIRYVILLILSFAELWRTDCLTHKINNQYLMKLWIVMKSLILKIKLLFMQVIQEYMHLLKCFKNILRNAKTSSQFWTPSQTMFSSFEIIWVFVLWTCLVKTKIVSGIQCLWITIDHGVNSQSLYLHWILR